jgi:hypothetical protein
MHFGTKNNLKSNGYHTTKHYLRSFRNFTNEANSWMSFLYYYFLERYASLQYLEIAYNLT